MATKTKPKAKSSAKVGKSLPKKEIKTKEKKMTDKLELVGEEKVQVKGAQLIETLKEKCTEAEAGGFILTVIGSDGAIVPFVGGRNLGEILVMEKLISKEVNRILESQISGTAQ